MPKGGFELVEIFQQVEFEVAFVRQHGGIADAAVPLADHDAVPLGCFRLGRVQPGNLEIEQGEHFHHAHGPADVGAPGPAGDVDDVFADFLRFFFQEPDFLFGDGHGVLLDLKAVAKCFFHGLEGVVHDVQGSPDIVVGMGR